MLDLLVVFDTIDHTSLLSRWESLIGPLEYTIIVMLTIARYMYVLRLLKQGSHLTTLKKLWILSNDGCHKMSQNVLCLNYEKK